VRLVRPQLQRVYRVWLNGLALERELLPLHGPVTAIHPDRTARCNGKMVPAEYLEDLIWRDCANYCRQPDDALAELQTELRQRRSRLPAGDADTKRLESMLLEKQAEKERVLLLYRRGTTDIEDTESKLNAIDQERDQLQTELAGLRAEADVVRSEESYLRSAEAMLMLLGQRISEIERLDDLQAKRQILESLVSGVRIDTFGEGYRKTYRMAVHYHFSSERVEPATSDTCARSRHRG
jgi:site-specific DNA recombinase